MTILRASPLAIGIMVTAACQAPIPTPSGGPSALGTSSATTFPAFSGETPGPDVSLPPRPAGLPGLSIDDVIAITTELQATCESYESNPELGATWAMQCTTQVADVEMTVMVSYWGREYVDMVHAVALPIPVEEEISDPNVVLRLFRSLSALPYNGSDPHAAQAWVTDVFGGAQCLEFPCIEQIGPSDLTYQLGLRGAGTFTLGPPH